MCLGLIFICRATLCKRKWLEVQVNCRIIKQTANKNCLKVPSFLFEKDRQLSGLLCAMPTYLRAFKSSKKLAGLHALGHGQRWEHSIPHLELCLRNPSPALLGSWHCKLAIFCQKCQPKSIPSISVLFSSDSILTGACWFSNYSAASHVVKISLG